MVADTHTAAVAGGGGSGSGAEIFGRSGEGTDVAWEDHEDLS